MHSWFQLKSHKHGYRCEKYLYHEEKSLKSNKIIISYNELGKKIPLIITLFERLTLLDEYQYHLCVSMDHLEDKDDFYQFETMRGKILTLISTFNEINKFLMSSKDESRYGEIEEILKKIEKTTDDMIKDFKNLNKSHIREIITTFKNKDVNKYPTFEEITDYKRANIKVKIIPDFKATQAINNISDKIKEISEVGSISLLNDDKFDLLVDLLVKDPNKGKDIEDKIKKIRGIEDIKSYGLG
jgi:hypothetical protein